MILNGVIPFNNVSDIYEPISLIVNTIPFELLLLLYRLPLNSEDYSNAKTKSDIEI